MMPSLYVLSRTAAYDAVRVAMALIGVVLSDAWLLERTSMIHTDPFASVAHYSAVEIELRSRAPMPTPQVCGR